MRADSGKPTLIVSGLARCGTSLTMQMLHACGLRCAGDFPSFEPPELNTLHPLPSAAWLSRFDAIKIIDPHRAAIPQMNAIVLWLDRNPAFQSLSQCKMLRLVGGLDLPTGTQGRIRRSLVSERPRALLQFKGLPISILRFEVAVRRPLVFATQIAWFCRGYYTLDPQRMAECLLRRRNAERCEPDMDIEMQLVASRNAAREETSDGEIQEKASRH